jgi:CrcB protein
VTAGQWAGVAALGALGAVGRWQVTAAVQRRVRTSVPAGTLVVNLLGALLLGLLVGMRVAEPVLLLLGGGLLGSFTTFSTWMVGVLDQSVRPAAGYLAGSLIAGFAVAAAGWAVGGAVG